MVTVLDCGGKPLDLSRPCVMGVLNVTPDSFSDGGEFIAPERAVAHAREMVAAGAAIIDVGGESTRPGAADVAVEEELRRVIPVVEALVAQLPVPVSVDTTKPDVMYAAAAAGAGMINDVMALRRDGALAAARDSGLPVCLMHMLGTPRTMQQEPYYDDVVAEIHGFLDARVRACERAGIGMERLIVDPGFGFGKNLQHTARLLRGLHRFTEIGPPVLVGLSRKSFLGRIADRSVEQRLHASVAVAALAVWNGASIVRAHDVAATVDALRIADFMRTQG